MNSPVDQVAKRVTLWGVAFLTVVTTMGFINKWFIADKITSSVDKVNARIDQESAARQAGDERIIEKLGQIKIGQNELAEAIGYATYSKAQIDKMKADADETHARLEVRLTLLERRIKALEGR